MIWYVNDSIWYDDMIYRMIYLTVIWLPPVGISTAYFYTQTIHIKTQSTQKYIEHKNVYIYIISFNSSVLKLRGLGWIAQRNLFISSWKLIFVSIYACLMFVSIYACLMFVSIYACLMFVSIYACLMLVSIYACLMFVSIYACLMCVSIYACLMFVSIYACLMFVSIYACFSLPWPCSWPSHSYFVLPRVRACETISHQIVHMFRPFPLLLDHVFM